MPKTIELTKGQRIFFTNYWGSFEGWVDILNRGSDAPCLVIKVRGQSFVVEPVSIPPPSPDDPESAGA